MASTEKQALQIVWENKEKASLGKIAKELRISPDYCRLICRSLLRHKKIDFFQGEYNITALGRKELGKIGMIKKEKRTIMPGKKVTVKRKPKKRVIAKIEKKKKAVMPKKKITVKKKPKEKVVVKIKKAIDKTKKEKKKSSLTQGLSVSEGKDEKTVIKEVFGLSQELFENFKKKGFRTLEDVATVSLPRLLEIKGLKQEKAAEIINKARAKLRKVGKASLWER